MSSADTRAAMNDLMDAELVRPLTPDQENGLGIRDGEHHVVFVQPLDDLTVATILFCRL